MANPQLFPNRFKGAEYARNVWHVTPDENTTREMVLKPEFWTHVAGQLKVGDHIEVLSETLAFWMLLLVVSVGRVAATVVALTEIEIAANTIPNDTGVDPEYDIKFKGPMRKWAIIRVSDGAYVLEGFQSREEASRELNGYLKAQAA